MASVACSKPFGAGGFSAAVRVWNGAACSKIINLVITEAQLLQYFVVVLTHFGSTPRRNFRDAMHFEWIVDGAFQLVASAF